MKVTKIKKFGEQNGEVIGVNIELTSKELHDLKVIANIPADDFIEARKKSTHHWIDAYTQTYNVYRLIENIKRI